MTIKPNSRAIDRNSRAIDPNSFATDPSSLAIDPNSDPVMDAILALPFHPHVAMKPHGTGSTQPCR